MEFEEVITVQVKIEKSLDLSSNVGDSVVMIFFTGTAKGKYFEGEILPGGIDTQIIGSDRHTLSARYMLKGKDYTGEACEMFIENNGIIDPKFNNVLFKTYPRIITNSKALSFLNHDVLYGEGRPTESGVEIKLFRPVD